MRAVDVNLRPHACKADLTVELFRKIDQKWTASLKKMRQRLFLRSEEYCWFVSVLGCQKSGASTLLNLLERDIRTRIFRESSIFTETGQRRLRLRPIPKVLDLLSRQPVPLVFAEPKVESHRANELLERIPRTRVIWMTRGYRSWIREHLQRRSGQKRYLDVMLRDPGDWRYEAASDHVRRFVLEHYHEGCSREDCTAMIWYCRNVLFLEQNLPSDDRALLIRCEELLSDSSAVVGRVYRFLGLAEPPIRRLKVETRGFDTSKDEIRISAPLEAACASLERTLWAAGCADH